MSYGDYVEQLTFLLFLKMADEQSKPPFDRPSPIPPEYSWPKLVKRDGDDLEAHYRHTLEALGKQPGMIGVIFRKAQNRVQDPAKLTRLIADLIDKEQWSSLDTDVKGDAYEGLLEKNAADVKGGAGQYFTPRPLIRAIVDVMRPRAGETLCDPACGTGGFLLAAHEYVRKHNKLDKAQLKHLNTAALRGVELVDGVARLCCMNLVLHGVGDSGSGVPPLIEEQRRDGAATFFVPVTVQDALRGKHGEFDLVLTNPPFGKKSSITVVNEVGEQSRESLTYNRDDFWASTSNKQLNFLQHVHSILKMHGRAAVVVPDNVLFEGGAGETIRRELLKQADVHTLLRLPTGVFYAQGVKANVLFFDRKPAQEKPWTSKLWIYDLRTNKHFTLKTNPLKRDDLDEFVECFNAANRHERTPTWNEEEPPHPNPLPARGEREVGLTGRWRRYGYDELIKRDKASLDVFWLRDESLSESDNLPPPDVIALEIMEDLEAALAQMREIVTDLSEPAAKEN
ncbi:MAG: N-6 DNA methylase [Gammaproteobacteria bacterium]